MVKAIVVLSESQDPISGMAHIKSPADARAFLGLSLREMSLRITDPTSGHTHHIDRSTWCKIEQGKRKLHTEQLRQVEQVLTEALSAELAYDAILQDVARRYAVRIKVSASSSWVTRVYTTCVKCGRTYQVGRLDSKRCKRCISKSKRTKDTGK